MKKILYLGLSLWLSFALILPSFSVQAAGDEPTDWEFDKNPVEILDTVKKNANRDKSNEVQDTQRDDVTSRWCKDIGLEENFTITSTLCYLKNNSGNYLQYMMYAGLTLATIFVIRNGFKLVTSPDRDKQMTTFKKNLIYIMIGVTLLLGFYYFLDIYVGIINLFSDR